MTTNESTEEQVSRDADEIKKTFVELAEELERLVKFVKEHQGDEERH